MAHGIRISNDAGDVLIDDAYRNVLLVASGSGTKTPAFGANTHTFAAQTVCAPLVFARPTSDGIYIGGATVSKTSFSVICDGAYEWAVFGLNSPVSDGSTFGLKVFDAAGELVFGSMYRPPRIRCVISQDMPMFSMGVPSTYPAFPYTLPYSGIAGRPWICLNSLPFIPRDFDTSPAMAISGSNVILRIGDYYDDSPQSPAITGGKWQWSANGNANPNPAWGGRFRMALAER